MNIKTRLNKLEALTPEKTEPLKIGWFSVLPDLTDPIGYTADSGAVTMRKPGETMAALHNRCYESAAWTPGQWHVFEAIL